MKIKWENLVKFIQDFKLKDKDGTICFEAIILYTTLTSQLKLPTEVQIIYLEHTGMEIIYLLNVEAVNLGIPEQLVDIDAIQYRDNEFLYLKGTSDYGVNYILSIHPTGAACEPSTLKELHAKIYN